MRFLSFFLNFLDATPSAQSQHYLQEKISFCIYKREKMCYNRRNYDRKGDSMQTQNSVFGKRNWWILIIFGIIGQIAWSVENMYFNLFVYETIAPDLDAVTLMVQLSGIAAALMFIIIPLLIQSKKKKSNE